MAPPDERPWRLFVAVPIPDVLRTALTITASELRGLADARDWRWTEANGWHLTLAFLGATDPSRVPALRDALLRAVDGVAAFEVASGGLGAFPSPHSPRVLWYGVTDRNGMLRSLARAVGEAVELEDIGRFRAHITLARARERAGAPAEALLTTVTAPTGVIPVEEVVLYRSHLGRGPARYEALLRAPLAAAVAGAAS